MKKLLFFICIFCVSKANAQNYLISFAGSGASTIVTNVKVENLTKSTSITINGDDILHLTVPTGTNSIMDNYSSELKIYPNPMTDNSIVEIFPPVEGNATITVLDITGKKVAQIQSYLENLPSAIKLSDLKNGFYVVTVVGNNYQFSGMLISNSKSNGTIKIEKVNSVIQAVNEKTEKIEIKGVKATIDMAYSTGDRIKFTGISGNFSTVITAIPASSQTITFNFIACTDGDNNNYQVVTIGNQIWMAENLKTTKYNDGTTIPLVTDNIAWGALRTPGYCWYNNDEANYKTTYGGLYNWYVAGAYTNGGKNVCPTGWHVPTDIQWTTLTLVLGGTNISGGKLKETGTTHWKSPNTGATNETAFTALPGGYRTDWEALFYSIGENGYWWSSTESSTSSKAWCMHLYYNGNYVDLFNTWEMAGFSVRCIKDN
jgi:uncharacterized protein (TIGR02145 family)